MSDEIQISVRWEEDTAVIDLLGDVTTFAEDAINQAYQSASSDGATNIIFNFRDAESFRVSIVGYTRQHTILGSKKAGDTVNLEADIIAKYVAQLSQPQRTGITADLLREHGFLVS